MPNEQTKRMSVDELLASQSSSNSAFRATIEPIEDAEDVVKITPWFRGVGCLCQLSLKVPKETIEWVELTDETHFCCGKSLRVAELHFKKERTISLNEVFSQLTGSAALQGQRMQQSFGAPSLMPPQEFTRGAHPMLPVPRARGGIRAPGHRAVGRNLPFNISRRFPPSTVAQLSPEVDQCYDWCYKNCDTEDISCVDQCFGVYGHYDDMGFLSMCLQYCNYYQYFCNLDCSRCSSV